jgi:membrane protease YdiL (CAAX protease family)
MSGDPETRTLLSAWRSAFGASRPPTGWWAWLRDPQFVIGVLAALPVWLALGLAVGGHMRVTFTATFLMSFLVVRPVLEELAFRGALQGFLLQRGGSRRIGPISRANWATTAAFVALHFTAQPTAWALAVAVPSLAFGHMRERFGSVLPAIALHLIYNVGFAATAWFLHR